MKMNLGKKVTLRKTGKTKVDSELSAKDVNSAKRKHIEDVMGQGDCRLFGTSRTMTDVTMVPPILMAGLRSASYRTKRSDLTLTGATSQMKYSANGGKYPWGFIPSCLNHGKRSVIGQLTPVAYNRWTVSDTVSIDEPAVGYMELVEDRNSARGNLLTQKLPGKKIQGTTKKQKAYGTFLPKCMRKRWIV